MDELGGFFCGNGGWEGLAGEAWMGLLGEVMVNGDGKHGGRGLT